MKDLEPIRKKIKSLETYAEKAYDEMYEARSPAAAGGYFSEVKEVLTQAITLARENGLKEETGRLEKRLDHIGKVYKSQFSR